MKIKENTHRYIEWIDPEEMHRTSRTLAIGIKIYER